MTCETGQGDCKTCKDRAPGDCIIQKQVLGEGEPPLLEYEYSCYKFQFSPRRPFYLSHQCVRCGASIPGDKPYLNKFEEGIVCWHCHREEIGLPREGGSI